MIWSIVGHALAARVTAPATWAHDVRDGIARMVDLLEPTKETEGPTVVRYS